MPTPPPRLDWWRFALAAVLMATIFLAVAAVPRHQRGGPASRLALLFFGASLIGFFAYRWRCLRREIKDGRFSVDEYRADTQRYIRGPFGVIAVWFICTIAITIGIIFYAALHR
jgi:hypothetical protein